LNHDLTKTSRSVYTFLDWLGDAGGLMDALKIIASFLVGLVQSNLFNIHLVTKMFSLQKTGSTAIPGEATVETVKQEVLARSKWTFNWRKWLA